MNNSFVGYSFGSVHLDNKSKQLLSKIINTSISHSKFTPSGSIFFGKYVKGLRPNFIASSQDLHNYLKELSIYLSKKLKLENPILSIYGDLHSCFSVTWHEDKSTFCENLAADSDFFNEKRKLLKFYIKLPLSYLDLSTSLNSRKFYLRSSSEEISYFDVRCTHRTYVSLPKQLQNNTFLFVSNLINKMLSALVKRVGGINWPISSNLYFLIYEDCPIFREYEKRELARADSQLS